MRRASSRAVYRNLLLGRPRREVVNTPLGGAAPRQPFVLFARDSHGGIIVASPGRVKGEVGPKNRDRHCQDAGVSGSQEFQKVSVNMAGDGPVRL